MKSIQKHQRRAPSLWARTNGAILLALFVLAQLGSMAHHALVPHGHCASDGAWTHTEVTASHSDCLAHSHEGEGKSDGPAIEDGHVEIERCSIPTIGEVSPDVPVRPCLSSWLLSDAAGSVELQAQEAQWQFPVFRLAPKQSPPHEA